MSAKKRNDTDDDVDIPPFVDDEAVDEDDDDLDPDYDPFDDEDEIDDDE